MAVTSGATPALQNPAYRPAGTLRDHSETNGCRATSPARRRVPRRSVGRAPARDVKDATGREGALLAGEPGDHRRDFLDLDETAHRDFRQHELDEFGLHLVKYVSLGSSRCNAVHQNVGLRQFLAERFGQPDQPGLRGGVVRCVRVALLAGHGCDVDDASIAIREHFRHDGVTDKERRDQVDVDHLAPDGRLQLPRLGIAARDAGIVDEDVDPTMAPGHGIGGGRD